jgi:uncharacterized small protein (TIGR04563 family)
MGVRVRYPIDPRVLWVVVTKVPAFPHFWWGWGLPINKTEVLVADNDSKATGSDKRKQSLYFPESMLQEIKDEAARLDRSLSWVVQRAWKMARLEIKKIPSVNDIDDGEDDVGA